MATHVITTRVDPINSGTWLAPAAAWSPTSWNGDSGAFAQSGYGSGNAQSYLEILGGLYDDGTIPGSAIVDQVDIAFDWAITAPAGNSGFVFATGGAGQAWSGNASGSATGSIVAPDTWANYVAIGAFLEWSVLSDSAAQAGGSMRIVVTNFQLTITYHLDSPTLTSVSPATGSTDGGVRVTLTGVGFTGKTNGDVLFGGLAATVVIVVNDSTITCNTPAHAAGAVDVSVAGVGTLAAGFTYTAAPSLDTVKPAQGPTTGGVTVTLGGHGFTGKTASQVTFGGVAVSDLVVVSDTVMTCVPAPHAGGLVDVAVVACGTLEDAYRYQASNTNARAVVTDTDAANLPPIPEPMPPVDPKTGKIEGTWLRWLDALKRRVEAVKAIDASTIISGVFALAQIPTIPWSKIDPTGSSLGNLTIRNAGDLTIGTLPAGRMPALTGDVTSPVGSTATTLATVNPNVGTFGDSTHVSRVTVNGKGLVTAASSVAIALPSGSALTKTDDTNVTATLTGTPASALLAAVNIALGWTGLLGLARGGTNANLSATGGAGRVLKQSSAGAAVTVATLDAADVSAGAALTKVDDANVTLTLGGTPATSLLKAASLTLGWTGLLADARLSANVPLLNAANIFTADQETRKVDPGIRLQLSTNPNTAGTEGYVAAFAFDASGANQKIGALAFQFTDTTHASGYASWNIHSSYMVAGVQADDIWLAGWGNHGAAFFPPSLAAGSAPGAGILKINGALTITGVATGQSMSMIQDSNGLNTVLSIRNPNAGNAAGTRFQIGTNLAAFAFTIDVFGTAHATKPGVADFLNQANADLNMGGWGVAAVTMGNAGVLKFPAYTATTWAAGDKYLVVDAAGNVHRSAIGPAS